MDWKMPDLGEGVQEGEIIKWLVKEGDKVHFDQHLVEIMTDKATMEIPSPIDGVVQKIVMKEGSIAKIGQTLAVIGGEGAPKEKREESFVKREAPTKQISRDTLHEIRTTKVPLASPAIRQLARELNVDLEKIVGTGPGGRIMKEDVEKVRSSKFEVRRMKDEERIPLRGLRRKIAEHMVLSRKTAAHFTHVDEVDLTELVALRNRDKKGAESKGVKLTYLPYIMKAVIEGLKKHPYVNASLDEATHEIILKKYYNIGVAVATEEGLIVPVVKKADSLSLIELAKAVSLLSEQARSHKIALEDLKGGTFTLTNIGSVGGIVSAPIINYPEVAIMGLHKIKPTPVVKDGKVVVRDVMWISVSADHRVVDGAYLATFLNEVIKILENPKEFFHEKI
ncbi:MAG: hypothetical protein A2W61_02775 [Deltaproteobacteria bacterium RIFCSPLOWO2_01_44_7]|nr:MAG: hypothetical protein A2712_09880 [Deltaproteobacteria bacterium RIFCSPHIGHO2_01_FULL_43_49]OGQ15421.1 MAG: hypothetical protein A3D22_10410 [Deltaproteobacteria bacterium RIFCSPHIGHO2_02_FULL_44_53]OGQ29614.1 MAG: hypothetical protein A3D98_10610 [Deltaproteobacteria bacterium RIFCSPHIGHO2_12_FULL_44_21]OGQ32227.1 MAG: hypothetical protein A2979_00255 [Deltaproteobacteria bacterium RIFCSPLOWO2_01_FULL_45_74]OGQ41307.1 MAG: hypothetical protein A2W61_02775 [Deltaproteobacteria bacterium 